MLSRQSGNEQAQQLILLTSPHITMLSTTEVVQIYECGRAGQRGFHHCSPSSPPVPRFPQGVARLARTKRAYEANLRKTFGGCLASNRLKGFASEGRKVPESARSRNGLNGDGNFDGGRDLGAEEGEDGPWSEGSESGEEGSSTSSGGSSSDDDDEDTKEAEDERVEALYNIATGGGGGGGGSAGETASVVHEEGTTTAASADTTTAIKSEKQAAPVKAITAEAGTAAPCSEPEIIPISALPALAKEFAVAADTPSEGGAPQPDLAVNQCSQAAETAALQEGGSTAAPVPSS